MPLPQAWCSDRTKSPPRRSATAPPQRRERIFFGSINQAPVDRMRQHAKVRENGFYQVPSPHWGGGQGEGPFNHQHPIRLTVLPSPQRCFQQTPPQSFGQLPLQGGARFLVSGPVAELARPLKSSPAGICESPLPSGEGVRGRGHDPNSYRHRPMRWCLTRKPNTPSALRAAPPTRGSTTFWLTGLCRVQ